MKPKRITLAALEAKFAGSLKWPGGSQWVACDDLAWMLRTIRTLRRQKNTLVRLRKG